MRFCLIVTCAIFITNSIHPSQKTSYVFSQDPIDVVIPCHPKDAACLEHTIASIKEYVHGIRRIIVVSSQQLTSNAEWVDEKTFPFSKETIAMELFQSQSLASYHINKPNSRMGWVFQQLLKLYASYCIANISSNVLIVDADLIFLKPVTFLQENGAGLYAVRKRSSAKYFAHINKLLPTLKRAYAEYSGVAHHMLFQKPILDDLFKTIENHHKCEVWKALLGSIIHGYSAIPHAALSEYEIYFNFAFSRTDQVQIRPLVWQDIENTPLSYAQVTQAARADGCDFVAVHIR